MTFTATRDDLSASSDKSRIDVDRVSSWLGSSYWASDRDRATIERTIAGSEAYGVYDANGDQVGFARLITDRASFAWIADVFVDSEWRGRGIGTWLVAQIVADLEASGVARIVLATRDAHGVYAKLGFEPLRMPSTWMEIDRRPNRLPT